MESRLFYKCLFLSLLVHVIGLGYFTLVHLKDPKHFSKPMQVSFREVKIKQQEIKKLDLKDIKVTKEEKLNDPVDVLVKGFKPEMFSKDSFKSTEKMHEKLLFDKTIGLNQKLSDTRTKITIPAFKSEKITNPKYVGYENQIRSRIEKCVYRYVDDPQVHAGSPAEVLASFIVLSDGTVKIKKIVESRTKANDFLKKICLRSIEDAGPFPPFPKDLNYAELPYNITIQFTVNSGDEN